MDEEIEDGQMSHPRCRTCEHFDPAMDDWDNPLKFGSCRMIAENWEMSKWNDETAENELRPFFDGHLASVSDASAYSANLNCSPDFYCAMHSEKKPGLNPYSKFSK